MLQGKVITIIAAMARNRAIGRHGRLPWHLPRELRHFKETTMGKPIVMGRRTWESIGRALPGRQNLVLSRDPAFRADDCDVVRSLDEAITRATGDEVMIIGGGQLYRESLPHTDRMILTLVDCETSADTWFPDWAESDWRRAVLRTEFADDINAFGYQVIELTRRPAGDETSRAPGIPDHPPA